jgi:hypothetical protein
LGDAIAALLDNPRKREDLSLKGLERSKLFREEYTAGKIYRHLIHLLGGIQ